MGYLFLLIALFAGTIKGFCGKKISGYINNFGDAIFANFIRMVICILIGFIMILAGEDLRSLKPNITLISIAALSGISTAVFLVTWLLAVRKSAYMMLDVFLMLGVLIPLIASNIFFAESIRPTQWLGMAIVLVAVMTMCSYNNSIKEKITLPSFLLLMMCGIASGVTDFSQKLFVKAIPHGSAAAFNFYTYIFAALFLIVTFFFVRKNGTSKEPANFKKLIGFIAIMAVCIFVNSYFKVFAAEHLSAVLLYPLNQGAALILSVGMSTLFFKEKLTPKGIFGIIFAFIGLIVINVL